jgi:hypothetical protein
MYTVIIVGSFLIGIGAILGIYKWMRKRDEGFMVNAKDGRKYDVQGGFKDPRGAANLLADVNKNITRFTLYLKRKYPDDERVKRLVANYKRENMQEGPPDPKGVTTSYVYNKGEKIVFCLRTVEGKLHDKNTVMFVVVHEMSHLATKSYDHNREFWTNFKFLLEEAVKAGLYIPIDYKKGPVKYCGMTIYSNPLYDPIA